MSCKSNDEGLFYWETARVIIEHCPRDRIGIKVLVLIQRAREKALISELCSRCLSSVNNQWDTYRTNPRSPLIYSRFEKVQLENAQHRMNIHFYVLAKDNFILPLLFQYRREWRVIKIFLNVKAFLFAPNQHEFSLIQVWKIKGKSKFQTWIQTYFA